MNEKGGKMFANLLWYLKLSLTRRNAGMIGQLSGANGLRVYRRQNGAVYIKSNGYYHAKASCYGSVWVREGKAEAFNSNENVEILQ